MRFAIDGKRYDTDKMDTIWEGRQESGTGVHIEGIYMTPRSKRVFVKTYSIWDRGDGAVVGYRVHEAHSEEIGHLADKFDLDELFELLPDDSE